MVDARHNAMVRACVERGPVLDLGCGYGTLTRAITREDRLECVGVDSDPAALSEARALCPECRFDECDAAMLPFADGTFGTIVMRDSLHHLARSPHWPAIAGEVVRVLRDDGRVVVLDPNITAIVRASRIVVRHEDETCAVEDAQAILEGLGFHLWPPAFNTLFTLPISGGYVGVPLVPPIAWVQRLLMRVEALLERVLGRRERLLRTFAWRYLLVADRS